MPAAGAKLAAVTTATGRPTSQNRNTRGCVHTGAVPLFPARRHFESNCPEVTAGFKIAYSVFDGSMRPIAASEHGDLGLTRERGLTYNGCV